MEPYGMPKWCREAIMWMKEQVPAKNNCEIARRLGVSEGTVRYWYRKQKEGRPDGRALKRSGVSDYQSVIENWVSANKSRDKRDTILNLYNRLKTEYGFQLSYDALRRYIRKHYPDVFRKGVCIRIETPPGELAQVDWKEDVFFQIGAPGKWVRLQLFVLELAFSRKSVSIVSTRKDLPTFLHCHQEALRRLGGLPRMIRTDCLPSAVVKWKGRQSVLTEGYRSWLQQLGMIGFPARPGKATDKGKVEKRIRDLFSSRDMTDRVYDSIEDIQAAVDRKLAEAASRWTCGATGRPVMETFAYEQQFLRPLPATFPAIPIHERRTTVRRDSTVYFLHNYYQVPERYAGREVLCQQIGTRIHIWREGELIRSCPWLPEAKGMVLLDREALETSSVAISDTIRAMAIDVADRQLDIYREITGDRP